MVEIQILSDLHLENPSAYDVFNICPRAPYLALLGDIGVVADAGLFTFIKTQLAQFEVVFFLLGNHEPWQSTWPKAKAKLSEFSDWVKERRTSGDTSGDAAGNPLGEFVLLDRSRYDLSPDVTILGCTLWSNISEEHKERISFGINDFYYISEWDVEEHSHRHRADLDWLNGEVAHIAESEPERKIVILTHYSPVTTDAHAVHPKHSNSPLSSGFATDLSRQECWINPQVRLWAFGHTHYNTDYTEDTTGKRVISNQRGYYFSQAVGFDVAKFVRI
jgi:hypothetical protein